MRYNGDKDGIIKTPKHGEIAFSMETVYLCKVHKLFCRDAQCPHYLPLKKWNSSDLAQLMPAGTMVSFYSRYVPNKIEQNTKKLFYFLIRHNARSSKCAKIGLLKTIFYDKNHLNLSKIDLI